MIPDRTGTCFDVRLVSARNLNVARQNTHASIEHQLPTETIYSIVSKVPMGWWPKSGSEAVMHRFRPVGAKKTRLRLRRSHGFIYG